MFFDDTTPDLPTPPGVISDEDYSAIQAAGGPLAAPSPEQRDYLTAHVNQYEVYRAQFPTRAMQVQQSARERRVVDLALDFDKTTAGMEVHSLKLATNDAERAEAKDAVLTETFMNHRLGGKKFMGPTRDVLRDAVATEAFGEGKGVGSDAAFATQARLWARKARDYEELLVGRDGSGAEAVALQNANVSKWATRAALSGVPWPSAYAQWAEQAKALPSYAGIKDKQPQMQEAFHNFYDRTAAEVEPHREALTKAFDVLRRVMAVKKEFAGPQGGEDFPVTPEKGGNALPTISDAEEALKGMSLADFRRIGIPALRAMAETAGASEGETMSSQLATAFFRPMEFLPGQVQDAVVSLSGPMSAAMDSEGGNYTPQDPAVVQADDEARTKRALMRSLAVSDIDPLQVLATSSAGKFLEHHAYSLSSTLGLMATMALGPAGVAATVAQIQDQNKAQLMLTHPEMSANDAGMVAGIAAPIQTALMSLSLRGVAGKMPGTAALLEKMGGPGVSVGKVLAGLAGTTITIYTSTKLQEASLIASQKLWHQMVEESPDGTFEGFQYLDPEAFFAALPLAMIGSGQAVVRDAHAVREMIADPVQMKLQGFDSEQIGKIQAMPTVKGQIDLLQQLWSHRDTSAMKARGADTGAQEASAVAALNDPQTPFAARVEAGKVVALADAVKDYRTAVEGARQALADMEDRGVKISSRNNDEGLPEFVVTDRESGQTTVHDKFADAMRLAQGRMGSFDTADAEALFQVADFFDMQKRKGVTETTELDPARETALDHLAKGGMEGEAMLERLKIQADREGVPVEDLVTRAVLGENSTEYREQVGQTTKELVSATVLKDGATPLTVVEEKVEGRWKAALATGALESADGLRFVRMAEQATGEIFLHGDTPTPRQVTEAISQIVVAEVFNRRKDGGRFGSVGGAVTRGLGKVGHLGEAPEHVGKFRGFLRAMKTFFGDVLKTATKLNKAKREGKLGDDYHAFVDGLLGLSEQTRHNAEVVGAAEAPLVANEALEGPAKKDTSSTVTFSIGSQVIEHNQKLREVPTSLLESLRNEYTKPVDDNVIYRPDRYYRAIGVAGLKDFQETEILRPKPDGKKSYDKLYAAKGSTAGRYDSEVFVEIDPSKVGEWQENKDTSGYVNTPPGSIRWDSPGVRVFRRTENGAYEVIHDNIGDEALHVKATDGGVEGATFALASHPGYAAVDAKYKQEFAARMQGRLSEGHVFELGDASDELIAGGFPSGPITAVASVFESKARQEDHPFPLMRLSRLPESLRDPIFIFKSKSHADRRVALTSLEYEGKNILAVVDFRITQSGTEISRIQSVYPKNTAGVIGWINEGSATYWHKEKGQSWLARSISETNTQRIRVHVDRLNNTPSNHDVKRASEAGGSTHAIASADYLELIARKLDVIGQGRDAPEKLAAFMRAKEQLEGMARSVRFNDANSVRNLSRAGIEREQATLTTRRFRELRQEIEQRFPHMEEMLNVLSLSENPLIDLLTTKVSGQKKAKSRIMGEREARKDGRNVGGDYDGARDLPGFMFGGTMRPDVLAQEAYEAGLIKGPYVDELWEGIDKAMRASKSSKDQYAKYQEEIRAARITAKSEGQEWADGQAQKQSGVDFERREVQRGLVALDQMLMSFPPEVRAAVGGFAALSQIKGNEGRMNYLFDRIQKVETVMERHLQKEYTVEMKDLLRKSSPKGDKDRGAKIAGKIGVEGHEFFHQIEPMMKLTKAKVQERLDALEKTLSGTDLSEEAQEAAVNEWRLLQAFGAWKDRSAAEMADAFATANDTYQTGRNTWGMVLADRKATRRALKDSIMADDLKSTGTREQQDAGNTKRRGSAKAKIEGFTRNLFSFGQTLQNVLGLKSKVATRWETMARQATRRERAAKIVREDDFHAALTKIYGAGTRLDRLRKLYDLTQVEKKTGVIFAETSTKKTPVPVEMAMKIVRGEVDAKALGLQPREVLELGWILDEHIDSGSRAENVVLPVVVKGKPIEKALSKAQAMQVWMSYQMEEYRPALARDGIDERTVAEIEKFLSPKDRELMGWMGEQYEQGYAPMNTVFQRMYGVALPKVKNYAPGVFENQGKQQVALPGETLPMEGSMGSGFLRKRQHHTAKIRLEDGFDAIGLFTRHVTETEHWLAHAEGVDEMRSVLFDSTVNTAIKAARGESAADVLRTWVDALENGGVKQGWANLETRKVMNHLMQARAVAKLGAKPAIWLKNLSNIFASGHDLGPRKYASSAGRVLTGMLGGQGGVLSLKEAWSLPIMQQRRREGGSPEMQQASAGHQGFFRPGHAGEVVHAAMAPMGWSDAVFTSFSAAVAYDAHYRDALKSHGADPEAVVKAHRDALDLTDQTVSRTAQPIEMMDKSLFELSLKHPMARVAFMFMSEARQKFAIEAAAFLHAKSGDGNWADFGKALALNHIVMASAAWAVGSFWRDATHHNDDPKDDPEWDAKDWLLSMAMGPVGGIPIAGGFFNMGLSELMQIHSFTNDTNLLTANWADAIRGVQAFYANPPDGEELDRHMRGAAKILNGLAGLVGGEFGAAAATANLAEAAWGLGDNFIWGNEQQIKNQELKRERKEESGYKKDQKQAMLDAMTPGERAIFDEAMKVKHHAEAEAGLLKLQAVHEARGN